MAFNLSFGKYGLSIGRRFTFSEQDNTGAWLAYLKQYGGFQGIDKFTCEDSYKMAGAMAEIFFPIDMIADACASLTYKVVNKDTLLDVDVNNSNLARLIKQPNPYDKFSDLLYKSEIAKLRHGNWYD